MSVKHIRDLLQMPRDASEVPSVAVCGDYGDKLTFGDPRLVLKRDGSHCEKCVKFWEDEKKSEKSYIQLRHRLRIGLFGIMAGGPQVSVSQVVKKALED